MAQVNDVFALTNPISKITGKAREDLTRDDIVKVIIDEGIERITFHYTALDGKIKELRIPVCNREQVETILTEGERVDGSSLFKNIVDPGKSDLYVVPVYKSVFLNPFDESSIDFVCRFIDKDGNLADFAPDNILLKAANTIKNNTGLELHALGELEFYLLGYPDDELFPIPKQRGYHASAPFVKNSSVLNEMLRYITQICGNVKYAHNEVGCLENVESDYEELDGKRAEQVEIEFLPVPIEEAADHLVLAKWIIRNVAFRHGYTATFVPKLETGHAGNGMHVHMMLKKDGRNAMVDKAGELNDNAKMLIGGLCQYAQSITAFGNMVSAAYLRLVPHQEAPTKVCWSAMNRSALIRVPLGWTNVDNLAGIVNPGRSEKIVDADSRQTVELRSPDGSAHTHFLLAGIAMAAEWGLNNSEESLRIAEQCHVTGNIHDSDAGDDLAELATSCAESAEKLLQQRNMYEHNNIFPPRAIDYIASVLQNENDRNLNNRLMALPDDDKLKESRRIMHRDIHKH
jgi:glutamine synthetase